MSNKTIAANHGEIVYMYATAPLLQEAAQAAVVHKAKVVDC